MIDGITTSWLPLDVYKLADKQGVDTYRDSVCVNANGLKFDFFDGVETNTGEIRKVCTLRGRLHKYANGGLHNADSFRLSDLCRVFTELKEVYGIEPGATRLRRVEFGVNIRLPYDPQRVLKAIKMYKANKFVHTGNMGLKHESSLYELKIYDKGRQCGVLGFDNILRIEIRAKVSFLKRNHISVSKLGDLLSADVWIRFEALLLKALEDIVIVEAVPLEGLSKKERDLLALFIGDGWQNLNASNLYKKKQKLNDLAERTGISSIKKELAILIKQECANLRDCEPRHLGDKINFFANLQKVVKVNEGNKPSKTETIKEAAKSTFLEQKEKRHLGDKINTWIRGDFIAYITPEPQPPDSLDKPPNMDAKLSYTARGEIKSRGKLPDIEEFNTG